jgi:hypothetical protein
MVLFSLIVHLLSGLSRLDTRLQIYLHIESHYNQLGLVGFGITGHTRTIDSTPPSLPN